MKMVGDMRHDGSANGSSGPRPFHLHHDAWGRLVLTEADGRVYAGVEPVRAFPVSDPAHGIAVVDAEGHEVVWIDDLDALPAAVRAVLEEEFRRREFVPVLRRVVRVSAPVEPSEWEVETDRGPARFTLNSEDDVRRLGEHRALVIDAHGVRYLIPDLRTLDAASRHALERYL
jgi:hypothetical protein